MRITTAVAYDVLERTPRVLPTLLAELPEELERGDEGEDTWSPYDVVGHLIHGERTDWISRLRTILDHGESREFEPFDRFAQFEESRGKSMDELLAEFAVRRAENLSFLRALDLQPEDLERTGRHPDLGIVTLGELLATWVVHDLGHIAQIGRVMAKQLGDEVGSWRAYLPVLAPRPVG
jgi:uncharacterized damage-inducible protein DinB